MDEQSELEQLRERLVNQAVANSELVTKLGRAEAELERVTGLMGQYADRAIENGTRADAAEAALKRVRSLHHPYQGVCAECCGVHAWPCRTIQALEG